jgi:tetratricopeptide (TPR) repeat protein
MKNLPCTGLLCCSLLLPVGARAADEPPPPAAEAVASPAETELQELVGRQNALLNAVAKDDSNFDQENFRTAMQQLANAYDDFLKTHHDYAPAYAAYGVFLGKVDMRKQSAALLLKANDLFTASAKEGGANTPAFVRTWALVKNQLGNYLAEEGKPLQAVNYYTAAIDLTPNEPLYHYQLGTLLNEARDDFIKSGQWPRPALERSMHLAFKRAAELAPARFEFSYRYAESFYDLDSPDWDDALKAWSALEEQAETDVERQTMRLHAANILIMQERFDHARTLLATVTDESLQKQKQRLTVKLPKLAEAPEETAPSAER